MSFKARAQPSGLALWGPGAASPRVISRVMFAFNAGLPSLLLALAAICGLGSGEYQSRFRQSCTAQGIRLSLG